MGAIGSDVRTLMSSANPTSLHGNSPLILGKFQPRRGNENNLEGQTCLMK